MISSKKDNEFRLELKNNDINIYGENNSGNSDNLKKEYTIEIIDKATDKPLETKKIKENEVFLKPDIIEKEEFTFKYFYNDEGKEIIFDDNFKITSDMKIYAEYVSGEVLLEEIKVEEEITIKLNEDYQLEYTVIPSYTNKKDIAYSSTNRYTASIDEEGLITGNREGICYITILDRETNISTRVKITVK